MDDLSPSPIHPAHPQDVISPRQMKKALEGQWQGDAHEQAEFYLIIKSPALLSNTLQSRNTMLNLEQSG
jgi:phage gp29-like protein